MQWKDTVAPIGTVWFAGPSIILAAVQIERLVLVLIGNILMHIHRNKQINIALM